MSSPQIAARLSGWELRRGDTLLGILRLKEIDQPFFHCEFQETEAFASVKPLFDQEWSLFRQLDSGDVASVQAWQAAVDALSTLGMTLVSHEDGAILDDFLLRILPDRATFRYI